MKTLKMSLANIQGKMNRKEMKLIMAGYGGSGSSDNCNNYCNTTSDCSGGLCPVCSPISNWAGKSMCVKN